MQGLHAVLAAFHGSGACDRSIARRPPSRTRSADAGTAVTEDKRPSPAWATASRAARLASGTDLGLRGLDEETPASAAKGDNSTR